MKENDILNEIKFCKRRTLNREANKTKYNAENNQ